MAYDAERAAFARMKSDAPEIAFEQFLEGLDRLHKQLDTADGGARFLFGYAVEMYIAGLFNAADVPVKWVGAGQGRPDLILVESNALLSVKSSSTENKSANIRLVNKLGRGVRAWDVATLFVFSEVGIIYADPETLPADAVFRKKDDDATFVRRDRVEELVAPRYRINLEIPEKPPSSKPREAQPIIDLALETLDKGDLLDLGQWVRQALDR